MRCAWHAYLININMVHLEDYTEQLVFYLLLGLRSYPLPEMSIERDVSRKLRMKSIKSLVYKDELKVST